MTEVERYRKFKLELEDITGRLSGLPQRIEQLKSETATTRDEAVRLELLGDADLARRRRDGIKSAQDEVRRIEMERDDLMHRRGILLSLLEETRKKAEAELGASHLREFAKAAKTFATAIKLAHKAELELAAAREAAAQAFGELDSRLVPLPTWDFLIIHHPSSQACQPAIERFFSQMKDLGFDLN